jgi:site-specific recombinase XerD
MPDSAARPPPDIRDPPQTAPESAPADAASAEPLPAPLALIAAGPLAPADALADLPALAAGYAVRARGAGTRRAYRGAWRGFAAWCATLGRQPVPADPELIAWYVTKRAHEGCAVSTIRVDLAAIRAAHDLAGLRLDFADPRLAMVVEGVARTTGTRPRRQAAPAVPGVLRLMLAKLRPASDPLGARDRAMLLIGFGAALRRAELVALTLGDVETVPGRGLRLTVRRSKTDQQGKGQPVAVCANPGEPAFCPAAALDAWMAHRRAAPDLDWTAAAAVRAERPLFCGLTKTARLTGTALSDKAVVRLVKAAARAAGLDPARYSGHSLRVGLATAAGDEGAGLADLMRQTRHQSTEVALGYLRPADLWRNNVTEKVFRGGERKD